MNDKKIDSRLFSKTTLIIAGVLLLLLTAVILLWHGNATSNQAMDVKTLSAIIGHISSATRWTSTPTLPTLCSARRL